MADSGARHPLVELTLSRIYEFVRDPGAVFWTFGFPIVLAIALGIAFREAPEVVHRVGVLHSDASAVVLAEQLDGLDDIEAEPIAESEANRALTSGRIDVLVIGDTNGGLTYRFDVAKPESNMARFVLDEHLQRELGREDAFEAEDEPIKGSGGRYIDFLVPGLVGLNIMGSAVWGIGFSVVDSRKRKLLKRLAATPMSRAHFLLSYMLSRLVFLAAEVLALVGFGWLVFDVPVRGSFLALAITAAWGALTMTGIAILIAARPRSVEVASGWSNLFMLPMWLLGGAFFSYERFPEVALPVIRALPLTALNDALREIMNYGGGLTDVLPQLGILTAWGLVSFVIALRWFRWQ